MSRFMSGLFHRNSKGVETHIELENAIDDEGQDAARIAASAGTLLRVEQSPDVTQELSQLRQELAQERTQREKERADRAAAEQKATVAKIKADASQFAAGQVKASRLMPKGAKAAESLHAFVHLSAAGLPTDGIDAKAALDEVFANTPPHGLTAEALKDLPAGAVALSHGADDADPDERARKANDSFFGAMGVARGGARTS